MVKSLTRVLLFGYGNPGRGDDALGPVFVEQFQQSTPANIYFQTDMQLLVEHATDLATHEQIVFVDADMRCPEPFCFSAIQAQKDDSYTSHALTPAALLFVYQQVYQCNAPPAFLLRIRGYHFALGDNLSQQASNNLNAAFRFFRQHYSL